MQKIVAAIVGILVFGIPSVTRATLTFTAEVGGVPTVSGATLENFNGPSPSILTLSSPAALETGTADDYSYEAPVFSGGTAAFFGEPVALDGSDASQYVAVFPNEGSATLTFSTPQNYLGLLWGSIGQGNELTFYDTGGGVIGSITGLNVDALFEGGYPATGTAYVNIISDTPFSTVVATDASDAFEFDDVAHGQVAVPEPATMLAGALLLLPFGGSALRILRKGRGA